ncbi:MAG: hypothetical protein M3461_09135, partial [Pseudomonadota bacterium]|nr:hypothetical protein [Pseudomonadota bacterium]
TKRAAERESHKLKARLSPGEKRNRKRMATVAAVYSIERQVRTRPCRRIETAELRAGPNARLRRNAHRRMRWRSRGT